MIRSMTGYGKAVAQLEGGNLTVEIRSLNAKSADVSLKTSLIPKDKDIAVRRKVADVLVRGTIDVFLTWEPTAAVAASRINTDLVADYCRQLEPVLGSSSPDPAVLASILRFPDVLDAGRKDLITEENWPLVEAAFDECLRKVDEYRIHEGEALHKDVTGRVQLILDLYNEIEAMEGERIEAVRSKILKAADELKISMGGERFEQEMILYLEKLDINEEKVRLRQHCKYFLDTIESEPYPGKKLGFIIQEMGREINTTGSKASHAGIQKCVVRCKDELEKIREQSMNIL
ncbi:MAG: YicC family protein [Bacteroidales bacterium]|nr:YicC family protein [Bacteroidales bacterium]